MEAQVPLVMFLLLLFVALFMFPWKRLAERWNKGPAYALGLAIGGLAVAATFFLPYGPTPWVYLIAVVAGIGFSAQLGLSLGDGAGRGRVRPAADRRASRRGSIMGSGDWRTKVSDGAGHRRLAAGCCRCTTTLPNVEQSAHTLTVSASFSGRSR